MRLLDVDSRLGKAVWWAFFAVCTCAFSFHFLCIQVQNMPMNPVKLAFLDQINAYVNPYFTQNWSFFAPDPIANDLALFVRGQGTDAAGRTQVTSWLNVSDSLIDAGNGRPLSPITSISLALSNAVVQYVNAANTDPRALYKRGGKSYLRLHLTTAIDPNDALIFTRIGAAALSGTYPRLRAKHVQVGIRFYAYPRFTDREKPDVPSEGHLATMEWQAMPAVASLGGKV